MIHLARALVLALVVSGCAATSGVGAIRFHNQPVVWKVDDRRDVPAPPATRRLLHLFETFESAIYRRITRWLAVPSRLPARDVNALDEVPDSTWFENRIGRRPLSPADVARGPDGRPPDLAHPLVVLSSKAEGATPGLFVQDRDGRRFLLKLDDPVEPTLATGTHVVVHRLLWACGYHVPNDHVGDLRREQLVLGDRARFTDARGRKRPMTEHDLDAVLARGARSADGSYRALFSELLPGVPLGGFAAEGMRADDPNDTIPHERRRVLRGLAAIAGWLQHTDMREQNTLDMYVEDPRRGTHHVMHYLIDFDKALGAWTVLSRNRPADGHAELLFDGAYVRSALALGLWKRPWEGIPESPVVGIAKFDSAHYRPGAWTPALPYLPFLAADHRDMLWAVAIMMQFSREHLRAAVEAARFADPRATHELTELLVARRDKTARHWLARVNPLGRFVLAARAPDRVRLCFADLELDPRVRPEARTHTRYRAATFDAAGAPLDRLAELRPAGPDTCLPAVALARPGDGYTIVRIDTARDRDRRAPIEVHLARDPRTGAPRIIGVVR